MSFHDFGHSWSSQGQQELPQLQPLSPSRVMSEPFGTQQTLGQATFDAMPGQASEFMTSNQVPMATIPPGEFRMQSGQPGSMSMGGNTMGMPFGTQPLPYGQGNVSPTSSMRNFAAQTLPPGRMGGSGRMVEGPQISNRSAWSSMPLSGSAQLQGAGSWSQGLRALPSERIAQLRDDDSVDRFRREATDIPRSANIGEFMEAVEQDTAQRAAQWDQDRGLDDRDQEPGTVPPAWYNNQAATATLPPPPAMFTTAAVPQMVAQERSLAQESVLDGDSPSHFDAGEVRNEENEYLHTRVEELEQERQHMERQIYEYQQGPRVEDLQQLEARVREAEASEANALSAHEERVSQIHDMEQELLRMRAESAVLGAGPVPDNTQHIIELQQQLQIAKSAEESYKQTVEEQAARLEDQAYEIQGSRRLEAQTAAQLQQHLERQQHLEEVHQSQRVDLERRHAEAEREKEMHMNIATQTQAAHRMASQEQSVENQQELQKKAVDYRQLEDDFDNHKLESRNQVGVLSDALDSETRAKEFHQSQNSANEAQIRELQDELTYRKSCETYHKKQGDLHRKEVQRLKRLREEDAPPKPPARMPLKALEERIMQLACFMMMGVCSLPIMGAIAVLADDNYKFWLGTMWPWLVIGGCSFVFILFAFTMQGLLQYALPEYRSQFTMAFTWATFAALLGVILVPLSLMANKEALNIASTISQGCLTAMPQSELLVDYSQVLYNIRLSDNCTGAMSVTECNGWSENKYTTYLQYLEQEFHCGPLCPESPPPARAVKSPSIYNTPMPTIKPTIPPPPLMGPPLQNALGNGGAFLQADDSLVSQRGQLHGNKAVRAQALPRGSAGVMETALPHMQARKLFSDGATRMTCYPLIATRLQVLVSTFGGLWYWEGMGLIIISLLTSIYAGLYFALGMS